MSHCINCGTSMGNGICPNCEEELFIFETQHDFLPAHLSDEFMSKVADQETQRAIREVWKPSPPDLEGGQ
jgi:hypothetical protein